MASRTPRAKAQTVEQIEADVVAMNGDAFPGQIHEGEIVPATDSAVEAGWSFDSYEEALAAVQPVSVQDELADEYPRLLAQEKDKLLNVECILFDIVERVGEQGRYHTFKVMTRDGRKFHVSDGSTGIHQQLSQLEAKGMAGRGVVCPHGFRKSVYDYTDPDGKVTKATTYFLDNSA